ncbi:SusD-like starch-binding protein associating with outer membrane [Algoriphagus ratkowskyi]|uniref:RagB/SusD family nutrient uptake outer membrane protein n=1 Tax=Algoriphagus ratkowskyi TaxID=57028 RepID=A0A2W7R9W1_9BACT|nr:RagB/SusD family nutrient uptake outer membrane protein [Algoriphagus ratkowskyi]PZX57718.1 SusD-like starch-binding protein associating with outer membrane [Algoriphagus ratkowskyi]TXD78987.1 RagB/SusD family nutrient uptake outer membrane protein [Algoriphagus ratkowskyi]
MKNIISKIVIAGALLVGTSCADDYLDTVPTDAVSEEAVFTSTQNAMAALNGIHRMLHIRFDSQGQAAESGVMIMRDVLAEDVVFTTSGNGWYVSTVRWLNHVNENSGDVRFVWRYYYKVIGNANMIISKIDNVVGPQAEKDEIKGQALAYRAWAHFNLVQMFAERYNAGGSNSQLGVPIVIEPISEGGARNTVEEVYAQINVDLTDALALLSTSRNATSHINIDVANGIKARVAMAQGKFTEAAQAAKASREGYDLMSESQLYQGFNSVDNPEWIWGCRQVDDQGTFFASFFAYMSVNFSSTNIRGNPKAINKLLYDKIPATDYRKILWDANAGTASKRDPFIDEVTLTSFSKINYMNRKFLAQANASSVGDVPYMRAAEMYLNEAEALARSGNDADAAQVLFDFASTRNPEYVRSTKTGNELIEEIMVQRRVELWGEGFRFYDLKRLNLPLDRVGSNHVGSVINGKYTEEAGTNNWQWQIPISEINANDNMVQNPL